EDRVDSLPAPRPKRAVPTRHCRMFLLRSEAGWLIEKRPPSGIWGGLWSLPQSELKDGPGARASLVTSDSERSEALGAARSEAERIAARRGLRISVAHALPAFVHVFTHFRLEI